MLPTSSLHYSAIDIKLCYFNPPAPCRSRHILLIPQWHFVASLGSIYVCILFLPPTSAPKLIYAHQSSFEIVYIRPGTSQFIEDFLPTLHVPPSLEGSCRITSRQTAY